MLFDQPYNAEISKNLGRLRKWRSDVPDTLMNYLVSMNRVINEIGADQIYVIPPVVHRFWVYVVI